MATYFDLTSLSEYPNVAFRSAKAALLSRSRGTREAGRRHFAAIDAFRFGSTLLLILGLLAGCKQEVKFDSSEAAAVETLKRAGAKLQSEPIASNEFLICVTGIDATDVPIGDADLAAAGKFSYLRKLVLHGTKVSDAGLEALKDCQRLETVDLSHSLVSGTGVHGLRNGQVKELNLSDSKFNDGGVAALTEIAHQLLRLNLAGTAISDEGLEQLGSLRFLEAIDLSRTKISGAGLRYLPGGVKQLNLSGTPIANAGLVHLERFTALEVLNLSETGVTDDAIPLIQAMIEAQNLKAGRRKFTTLILRKTSVSDTAVAILQQSAPGLVAER